jgi:phosphoglycolate phosphatase
LTPHASLPRTQRMTQPTTQPHTIVFDLDGTLADTALDLVATLNITTARDGLPPLALQEASALLGAGARALIERAYAVSKTPLSPAVLDAHYGFFLEYYRDHIADHTKLFPGVIDALDALAADGHVLAVCTNKMEPHAKELLSALGVSERFAFIAGRETFSACKPDPLHLTETIRAAGGHPARAIMVGDSRTDIDTAKNARIPVVAVSFGYTDQHVSTWSPEVVIDHFDALVAAVKGLIKP